MTDEKSILTITGGEPYHRELLARFIGQELRRAIGHNETALTTAVEAKPVDEREIRELEDYNIEIFIPEPPRVVSYDLNSSGEPAFLTMHFSGIGEHSFRGRAKKVAWELGVGTISARLRITTVGVDVDSGGVVIRAEAIGRQTLDEMKAEIEQYVRQRLLDD